MNVNFRNTSRTRKREHDKEGEQELLTHIQVSKMCKINIYPAQCIKHHIVS